MRIIIEEKRILVVFGCGNYQNTIKRLCMVAALIPIAETKALFYQGVRGNGREGLSCFYQQYSYGNGDI